MKHSASPLYAVLVILTVGGLHAQEIPAKEPFRLSADVARFRGADDSTSTIEVHYAIAQAGLNYTRDSSGWRGAADITILARKKDSLMYGDRWLVPHAVSDTAAIKTGMNLVGVYPFQLNRGEYVLTIIARDRYGPGRLDSAVIKIPVKPVITDRVMLSDIEFASVIRQGSKQSPFHKNTLDVIPNVGALYGESQKAFVYMEAYNLLLGGEKSDYTLRSTVYDAVGKELLSRDRSKKRSGESAVLVDQFDVDKLKSGTYTLVVSLLDTAGTALSQSGRKFFVYNPTLGIDSSLLASGSALPLAVYSSMEEAELDRDFRYARFELTDAEKGQYGQLKGTDVKRKFLSDLWRRRPPGARDEYMSRVAHVNANFGVLAREGYRTDRGRVFIVYGQPDDYERHPNESDM